MKKHYLTLTRLLMVMLMAVGFSTAGQAAESRGDSIYNTASTDLQSVIRDIYNLSLQYQNVTSIRNFLDKMASQGTATLKNTNSKWQIKKDSLQTMLSDLYDKQFEIRTEYEKKLNQLWADKDYEGYKKAQAEYEQQLKNYENKEKELRDQYDEGVKKLANLLVQETKILQQQLEQSTDDMEAALQIYKKCNEATLLLDEASDAQRQSEAGKALNAAINESRSLINGSYTEVGVMVKMLENLLDFILKFNQSITAISTPQQSTRMADIYSINGTLLLRHTSVEKAAGQLPAGLYIMNGKKVLIP